MTKRAFALAGAIFFATALIVAQSGRTIQVDITYTGSGKVDAGHKIYVALWDTATFDTSPPAAILSIATKSGTVTFNDVKTVPAYVSTAYDPTGKWDAQSPPPSGSSIGMYGKPPVATPINVDPGKSAKIKLSFDDSNKVP